MTEIRVIEDLEEALKRAARLEEAASATREELGEERLPAGAVEEFLRARFEEPETLLLVAEREGAEPGLCLTGAWREPLSRLSYAAVLALHVDPSMRHRGIARALVARAVEVLLERGVERLGARVEHNDDARISMGERWGWTRAWEWMDSGPRA